MAGLRLFVCFSGKDNTFIRRLIDRLNSQPLSPWVFESEDHQIKGGERISSVLRGEIRQCRVFIPIVSENSFNSHYARSEVEYALELVRTGHHITIVPFVTTDLRVTTADAWPRPYSELADIRHRHVDFNSPSSLETVIIQLCKELDVEYRPCVPHSFRLPFMSRFVDEIENRSPRRDEYDAGIYRRLMVTLSEFSEAFEATDFGRAEQVLRYLIATCEYEFPDVRFYYPYVVRAVCLMLADRDDEAQAVFESLLTHPQVDESVFGGLAMACGRNNDFEHAMEYYRQAAIPGHRK